MAKEKKQNHKPIIETIINTTAIALTGYGVAQITIGHYMGCVALLLGISLEFGKYWGRNNLW